MLTVVDLSLFGEKVKPFLLLCEIVHMHTNNGVGGKYENLIAGSSILILRPVCHRIWIVGSGDWRLTTAAPITTFISPESHHINRE